MSIKLPADINSFLAEKDQLAELLPLAVMLFERDVQSAGDDIALDKNAIVDIYIFRDLVKDILHRSGGFTSEKVMRLLYRVDVPMQRTADAIGDETKLAEQIIIRELQKAWTRKYFG